MTFLTGSLLRPKGLFLLLHAVPLSPYIRAMRVPAIHRPWVSLLLVLSSVACDKPHDSQTTTAATAAPMAPSAAPPAPPVPASASATASAAASSARPVPLEGNALSGLTAKSDLMTLASAGQKCQSCFFNGRCALLSDGRGDLSCCDYVGGKQAGAWSGGTSGTGHAAECLASSFDAPYEPAKAHGELLPLAKPQPGSACRACGFDASCKLVAEGTGSAACCDYVRGKTPGAWKDDDGTAARCFTKKANLAK